MPQNKNVTIRYSTKEEGETRPPQINFLVFLSTALVLHHLDRAPPPRAEARRDVVRGDLLVLPLAEARERLHVGLRDACERRVKAAKGLSAQGRGSKRSNAVSECLSESHVDFKTPVKKVRNFAWPNT